MTDFKRDIWTEWLLNRRFGGNREQMQNALTTQLYPVRNRLLSNARLQSGNTVLDVGCGDGLIGFGALEQLPEGKVIFSDASQDVLAHLQQLVLSNFDINRRCEILRASAEDLAPVPTGSVDVVAMRSVLIYVSAKEQAFREFWRVLRPHGRLSLFEPINSFGWPEPPNLFDGCDVTPVLDIAAKVKSVYSRAQPPHSDPMFTFTERDLVAHAEKAGFAEIHLELKIEVRPLSVDFPEWDTLLRFAPNPKMPTLEEAMDEALTVDEMQAFVGHLRPLIEGRRGTQRLALAYLWATRN